MTCSSSACMKCLGVLRPHTWSVVKWLSPLLYYPAKVCVILSRLNYLKAPLHDGYAASSRVALNQETGDADECSREGAAEDSGQQTIDRASAWQCSCSLRKGPSSGQQAWQSSLLSSLRKQSNDHRSLSYTRNSPNKPSWLGWAVALQRNSSSSITSSQQSRRAQRHVHLKTISRTAQQLNCNIVHSNHCIMSVLQVLGGADTLDHSFSLQQV